MNKELKDLAAEAAVIGCMVAQPDILPGIMLKLNHKHFADPFYSAAYNAAVALYDDGKPVDEITLPDKMREQNHDFAGAKERIADLAEQHMLVQGVDQYANVVLKYANKRRIRDALNETALAMYDDSVNDLELYTRAVQAIEDAVPSGRPTNAVGGPNIVNASFRALIGAEISREERIARGYEATWPWRSLRRFSQRLRPGQPGFLIAEGGSGKTMLLMEIAKHNAMNGGRVFYVHTEDEAPVLLMRQMASLSGIPYLSIENADYSDFNPVDMMLLRVDDKEVRVPQQLISALHGIDRGWRGGLWFIDAAGKSVAEILFETVRLRQEVGPPDLIIFDWFLDHDWSRTPGDNDVMRLTRDIQSLKTFCGRKETRTRLLVATQTGKTGAGKTRLGPYDAYMTSAIAHYGKLVLTIHRQHMTDHQGNNTGMFEPWMDLSIVKANLDRIGTVRLTVKAATMRIVDPLDEMEEEVTLSPF